MFVWNEEKLRWHDRAVSYSGIDEELAEHIYLEICRHDKSKIDTTSNGHLKESIGNGQHMGALSGEARVRHKEDRISDEIPLSICDLGCGSGYLSFALVKRGFDVTAMDISTEAVKHVQERLQRERSQAERLHAEKLCNLTARQSDFRNLAVDDMWDVVIMCFMGSFDECMEIFEKHCRRQLIIIVSETTASHVGDERRHIFRDEKVRRLKELQEEIGSIEVAAPCDITSTVGNKQLPCRHITYDSFNIEFGQPFLDEGEAVKYAREYGGDTDLVLSSLRSTDVGMLARGISRSEPSCPLYLPNMKKIGIYTLYR